MERRGRGQGSERKSRADRRCERGRRRDYTGEERRRQSGESGERKEGRQSRKREGDEKEEDAWCGQDRRANGGHRTEMASGSAFQYSTLATLGHPISSTSHLALAFLFFSIHAVFLFVPAPRSLRSFPLSPSFWSSSPVSPTARLSFRPDRRPSSPPGSSSFSDRSSASSFGLRVLLFRYSAFLSFRSLATGSSDGLSSLRRHYERIHSADFIEHVSLSLSLSFFRSRIPRVLSWISRSCAYFSIKSGD